MNYNMDKDVIFNNSLIFNDGQELPVDMDFSLPDYCPDIQKILKCQVKPAIISKNVSGDRLNIDGNVNINLIYTDSEKSSVRCYENTSPFSCYVELKSGFENSIYNNEIKLGYINCKAVSPRKIDVHGAFTVHTKVYNKEDINITSNVNGEDIQQQVLNLNFSNLVGNSQQVFSVNEVLNLSQNQISPEIILRSDINFNLEDYKFVSGKIIIDGNFILRILYIGAADLNQIDFIEYSIPISQIIEVPNVTEKSKNIINIEILNYKLNINNEVDSENNNLITADIKAIASVMSFEDKKIKLISDVYSTNYVINNEYENIKLSKLEDVLNLNFSDKKTIELSEFRISSVVDIWANVNNISSEHKDGKIIFSGKTNLNILAFDTESMPFYIERAIEFEFENDFVSENSNLEVDSKIIPLSLNYKMSGSSNLEIQLNYKLHSNIFSCYKYKTISESSTEKEIPKDKDTNSGLIIYYSEPGEKLWDIARKYYTSVEEILKENNLEAEITEQKGMLLIPNK
ncbi:MAG: DUF3794 domain-containing protein [Candidatus Paraimprobicoccus trichonymphae]|uniref:DUF3794 domain-containing protein n=1 Tax=Candidatus Paraimprobicoccus trichonymphae TaxID=3033793 RepID=A0AA48KXV7_9FIRM|nr:MAG: DUF3794 domain-containing protein [Candidatus Paraimprobicoccus trichonymphae]